MVWSIGGEDITGWNSSQTFSGFVELGPRERSPISLSICETDDMSLELLVATVASLQRHQGNLGFTIVLILPLPAPFGLGAQASKATSPFFLINHFKPGFYCSQLTSLHRKGQQIVKTQHFTHGVMEPSQKGYGDNLLYFIDKETKILDHTTHLCYYSSLPCFFTKEP